MIQTFEMRVDRASILRQFFNLLKYLLRLRRFLSETFDVALALEVTGFFEYFGVLLPQFFRRVFFE